MATQMSQFTAALLQRKLKYRGRRLRKSNAFSLQRYNPLLASGMGFSHTCKESKPSAKGKLNFLT